jgi:hypothetical protein
MAHRWTARSQANWHSVGQKTNRCSEIFLKWRNGMLETNSRPGNRRIEPMASDMRGPDLCSDAIH